MGIGITELIVILGIVLVIFGTKRLRNIGQDLGGAIKGFRSAMRGEEEKDPVEKAEIESEKKDEKS